MGWGGHSFAQSSHPRQPLIYRLSLQIVLFWTFHINRVILYMAICIWLLSLTMFSRFGHVVVLPSFLWLNNIHLFVWLCHILFIHSPVDGLLACLYLGPSWVMLLWAFRNKFLGEHMFLILFHLQEQFPNPMVTLCWTYSETDRLFSKGPISFSIPLSSV